MKKIIPILLLLTMLTASLFGCETSVAISRTTPNPKTDFEYSVLEDGTIGIDKYIGTDTAVLIPDTIDNMNVTAIKSYAFFSTSIKEVAIPETVLIIDSSAFESCKYLEKVILPEGLKTINGMAFRRCESLSFIELPQGLEALGCEAFRECKSLKSLRIPPNCFKNYSQELFNDSGIETLELSEGITSIPSICILDMPSLKKLILPTTLKEINSNSIAGCPELEEIILPEGLEKISNAAFAANSKLKEITIPKSVRHLPANAFSGCDALRKIVFEGDAPDNVWYSDDYQDIKYYHHDAYKDRYTIYYHKDAKGFTSPTWYDYPTQIIE